MKTAKGVSRRGKKQIQNPTNIITNTKNEKDICGRQRLVHCEEVWNLPGGATAANSTCSVLPLSFEKDVNEDEKIIFHFHFYFNDE